MAFFKFSFPGQKDQDHSDSAAQSMESLRKRVKHRLMGSAVLVILAVIGFPMVFDSQPRPLPLDMAIDIPDKAKVSPSMAPQNLRSQSSHQPGTSKAMNAAMPPDQAAPDAMESNDPQKGQPPGQAPTPPSALAPALAPASASASKAILPPSSAVAAPKQPPTLAPPTSVVSAPIHSAAPKDSTLGAKEGLSAKEEIVSPKLSSAADSAKVVTKTEAKGDTKTDTPSPAKLPANAKTEIAKPAVPKKEESKVASDLTSARYVIQVGAFSDEAKVKQVREKLEKAGLHTFVLPIVDKGVTRTRVRLGPFTSKDEANKSANKAKALNFQPNIFK